MTRKSAGWETNNVVKPHIIAAGSLVWSGKKTLEIFLCVDSSPPLELLNLIHIPDVRVRAVGNNTNSIHIVYATSLSLGRSVLADVDTFFHTEKKMNSNDRTHDYDEA